MALSFLSRPTNGKMGKKAEKHTLNVLFFSPGELTKGWFSWGFLTDPGDGIANYARARRVASSWLLAWLAGIILAYLSIVFGFPVLVVEAIPLCICQNLVLLTNNLYDTSSPHISSTAKSLGLSIRSSLHYPFQSFFNCSIFSADSYLSIMYILFKFWFPLPHHSAPSGWDVCFYSIFPTPVLNVCMWTLVYVW